MTGTTIAIAMIVMVLFETYFSYNAMTFFPSEVMAREKIQCVAFVTHGGMWGDLLLLPPLVAFIVYRYGYGWSNSAIAISAMTGIAITLANHLLLIYTSDRPDPIGWKGEKISAVIGIHFVYMSTVLTVAGLFFFSPLTTTTDVVIVSTVLGMHTFLGTHVLLGMINRWKQWKWCPDFLKKDLLAMQAGIWTALVGLSWFSGGMESAIIVAGFAAAIAIVVISFEKTTRR